MLRWRYVLQSITIVCLFSFNPIAANATCALPNTLSNGQLADASQVMGNFASLLMPRHIPMTPRATF